nr:hypothetical protein CFP56_65544 [Quercus suber]
MTIGSRATGKVARQGYQLLISTASHALKDFRRDVDIHISRHYSHLDSRHSLLPTQHLAHHYLSARQLKVISRSHHICFHMASFNLRLEQPGDDELADQMFPLIRNALQATTGETLESAGQKLANLLPEGDPDTAEAHGFCDLCIVVAEQIPYNHPKLADVVTLVRIVLDSPRFSVSEKELLRRALEGGNRTRKPHGILALDVKTMAATQILLILGRQILYDLLNKPRSDLRPWFAGPTYGDNRDPYSINRWHFWRDGLRAVAAGKWDEGEKSCISGETKELALRASNAMDAIEKEVGTSRRQAS